MKISTGRAEELSPFLMEKLSRYRHKVFIEKLGWQLPTYNGQERDQFDRDDALYIVSQDDNDEINGCARLLPTVKPYLLGEIFPGLMGGAPIPRTPDVWELSRFAAVDFNAPRDSALAQFSSPLAVDLLEASLECAAAHRAHKVITVSPMGVERLLRKAGFRAERAGPPMRVEGSHIFGCWITCRSEMDWMSCQAGLSVGAMPGAGWTRTASGC